MTKKAAPFFQPPRMPKDLKPSVCLLLEDLRKRGKICIKHLSHDFQMALAAALAVAVRTAQEDKDIVKEVVPGRGGQGVNATEAVVAAALAVALRIAQDSKKLAQECKRAQEVAAAATLAVAVRTAYDSKETVEDCVLIARRAGRGAKEVSSASMGAIRHLNKEYELVKTLKKDAAVDVSYPCMDSVTETMDESSMGSMTETMGDESQSKDSETERIEEPESTWC